MHDSCGKDIFIPPVLTKVLTSKVTQLVLNPRCDITGFSHEVFHDRIDQSIDSVRDSFSYAFVKDGVPSSSFWTTCLLSSLDSSVRQLFHHCRSFPMNPRDMSSMTSIWERPSFR